MNWEWFQKPEMVQLFVYLLLKANVKDKSWQGAVVKRGSLVTTNAQISLETGLSPQTIRTCIKRLIETNEILYKSTNKNCTITICNYDRYQDKKNNANEQLTSNQRTTNEQSTSIYNIYDNITEENKRIREFTPSNEGVSGTSPDAKDDSLNVEKFKMFFNAEMDKANAQIPRIKTISDRRLDMLRARCRKYGKEALVEAIKKAAKSDFLNGGGSHGFVADFDWIMRPNNFPKVLEGSYDDRQKPQVAIRSNPQSKNVNDIWK